MTTWDLLQLLEPCCYIQFIGLPILILLGIWMTGRLIIALIWRKAGRVGNEL